MSWTGTGGTDGEQVTYRPTQASAAASARAFSAGIPLGWPSGGRTSPLPWTGSSPRELQSAAGTAAPRDEPRSTPATTVARTAPTSRTPGSRGPALHRLRSPLRGAHEPLGVGDPPAVGLHQMRQVLHHLAVRSGLVLDPGQHFRVRDLVRNGWGQQPRALRTCELAHAVRGWTNSICREAGAPHDWARRRPVCASSLRRRRAFWMGPTSAKPGPWPTRQAKSGHRRALIHPVP